MPTEYSTNLGLALPVEGELSGTWGDMVNNGITDYLDIAVAGTLTLSGDGAVTLTNTNGDTTSTNIGSTTAQYAVIKVTGTLTTTKVITAPSGAGYSKTYIVDNSATGGTVTLKASGQTGISVAVGEKCTAYFNGTDYVKVSGSAAGAAAGSTTQVQYNSSGSLAGSANLTFDGTTLTATGNTVISSSGSTDALRITQTGTGNALLVEDEANPDASPTIIDNAGRIGVGTAPPSSTNLVVSKTLTGNVNSQNVWSVPTFQSDVTSNGRAFRTDVATQAASFTLTALAHYDANQGTIGAGSTVTNQYGFIANSTLTGATNNYGFFGNIASGSGRYNFYAAGTADNYMAGSLGIGAAPFSATNVTIAKNITGTTTAYGVREYATVQSDVTNTAVFFEATPFTQAAAFTLTNLMHYRANQGTIGAGSTVTNQYGYIVESNLTGATNNYGFYGNIASGTGRYNLYMNGTAANYFGGQVQLGQDYIEKVYTANSSTAITIDLANGSLQIITLTGSPTITMPTAVAGKSFTMLLKTGAGSFAVTWSTVNWPGGTAPTITTTASKMDKFVFTSDGTNWYGSVAGQAYAV